MTLRQPTTTTTYKLACTGANQLQSTISVTVTINPRQDGICGTTVNGQSLSSAPSGAELCDSGTPTPTPVNGGDTGPWTWTCQGIDGGTDSKTCTANSTPQPCPVATASGHAMASADLNLTYTGVPGNYLAYADGGSNENSASYFGGTCVDYYDNEFTITTILYGKSTTCLYGKGEGACPIPQYNDFVLCIATRYAQNNLSGYANCTPSTVYNYSTTPVKVNLAGKDARLNSTTPTNFLLTLKDDRTLEGHVTGGLILTKAG